jgi:hypothetical protein
VLGLPPVSAGRLKEESEMTGYRDYSGLSDEAAEYADYHNEPATPAWKPTCHLCGNEIQADEASDVSYKLGHLDAVVVHRSCWQESEREDAWEREVDWRIEQRREDERGL